MEISDCLGVREVEEANTCNTPPLLADDFYPFVRREITPRSRITFNMLRVRGENSQERSVCLGRRRKNSQCESIDGVLPTGVSEGRDD